MFPSRQKELCKTENCRGKIHCLGFWLPLAGEPGGHQARQQEEDRADPTSSAGTQTRECLTFVDVFLSVAQTTLAYLLLFQAFNHWGIRFVQGSP